MEKKGTQEELWNKLEKLCTEWKSLSLEDSSRRMSLNMELTRIFLELFPKQESLDALGKFWLLDFDQYDSEKGDFKTFVLSRLGFRRKDVRYEDEGMHRIVERKDGVKVPSWTKDISLDAPAGEDSSHTLTDTLVDRVHPDGQEILEAEEWVHDLISLMVRLSETLTGQAKNSIRIGYFRMFFTEGIVDAIHTVGDINFISRERDLFDAIKQSFLDFFMEERCRTVQNIMDTNVKLYGNMVQGRPMEEPGHPFPNDIYIQYMLEIEGITLRSASTVTNQRTYYRNFLKEMLG